MMFEPYRTIGDVLLVLFLLAGLKTFLTGGHKG